jgi:hypothetical protein
MEHAVKTGSGTMICMPDFIKTGAIIEKLRGGVFRHTGSTVIS